MPLFSLSLCLLQVSGWTHWETECSTCSKVCEASWGGGQLWDHPVPAPHAVWTGQWDRTCGAHCLRISELLLLCVTTIINTPLTPFAYLGKRTKMTQSIITRTDLCNTVIRGHRGQYPHTHYHFKCF